MVKYCLPIIKTNKEDIFKEIDENKNNYQFFEVWLDYIKGINNQFINNLSKNTGGRLIVVFRRQNLENIQMDYKKRLDIIGSLENSQVLMDLDINNQLQELRFIKENKLKNKLIISYHNYALTPDKENLLKIIEQMKPYHPYIYKVACLCKNEEDSLKLLELLVNIKKQNLKYIILGMGTNGLITRIFGTLWGNEITFAPLTLSAKSAPGQLTREQMETIFSKIQ